MFSARLPATLHTRLLAYAMQTGQSMNAVLVAMTSNGLDKAERALNG